MKYHIHASIVISLLAFACAEQRSSVTTWGHAERGSEEFSAQVRIGYGFNHPAIPRPGSSLNLTGQDSSVFSLAMDPAADIWQSALFDTTQQSLIPSETSLVDWSTQYIASHKAELGLDVSELAHFNNTLYEPFPDQIYVTFQRQFEGREVRGAFVQFIFVRGADGYRLREVQNNSYGPIALGSSATDSVSAQAAVDATGIPSLEPVWQKSLIYPQLGADGRYEFRQATEFELADHAQDESYKIILDNDTQTILAAEGNRYHAKQQLTMETFKNSYITKEVVVGPMSGVQVDTLTADANGTFDTNATQATVTLTSAKGPVVSLTGNQQNLTPYSFPVTFAANGVTKVAPSPNVDAAALNAYAALLEVNDWVGRFLTPQQAPILATGILVKVNMIDGGEVPFCNAFFSAGSLNFYAQGAVGGVTCPNTALIKDVMYHEWGHALDFDVGVVKNTITDGAFSEGIGDITATLAMGDPVVGRGFTLNNPDSKVRTVDPAGTPEEPIRVYPPANATEAAVHSQGQIIGGTFWDLRRNLVALYGPEEGTTRTANFFFKHLLVTDRYIDSYASVLRLDDDDNNPATPSPHYCAINKAFGKHRLIGAATLEGPSCVDQDQGLKVRVDVDNGDGTLNLLASSFGAASIVFCPGKVTSCPADANTVEFTSTSITGLTASETKKFYQAAGTVKVKEGEMYTLISRDSKGAAVGLKTLTFGKRDQSSDLSQTLK
ncbi:hypothetical protein [Oligoflexus tunisiensis]|uniref:hypothetical protein n=1 Tax=Oligoflexus tunisiensis TaxID=708132 RepID=UPI00114D0098|nr:hypothetical protein [Oligoflexus tunisiensis]